MNKIILDEDSRVITISKNGTYNINELKSNIKIVVAKNITATINVIYQGIVKHTNWLYEINEYGNLTINKVYCDSVKEENCINLIGEGAKINYNYSSITRGEQEILMDIKHLAKNTHSNIVNHVITENLGIAVFNINALVKKGITGCDLSQDTKIITIGNKKSLIKPNLLIDEYDVNAKHSAYIGNFKDENVFYLQSRGITYEECIKLLKKAFLIEPFFNSSEICDFITNKLIR